MSEGAGSGVAGRGQRSGATGGGEATVRGSMASCRGGAGAGKEDVAAHRGGSAAGREGSTLHSPTGFHGVHEDSILHFLLVPNSLRGLSEIQRIPRRLSVDSS